MLLNHIGSEVNELTSHFSRQLRHLSNFKVLDVSEFLFDALEHTFFKTSLETYEVIEM